jgi:glycosyltransferase involved in cell wall biosynthesis
MKVLFTFGGLPHYYNYVLSKLSKVEGLEIIVLIPQTKSETIGKGVFQTTEGVDFKIIETKEYKTWYGKTFLKNASKLIDEINPDVIVIIWPYILNLLLNPLLFLKIKKKKIKLIYKDIPFGIPKFKDGLTFKANILQENSIEKIKFSGKLNIFFLTFLRKIYLNIVDAHVNYIEEAYDILGSYGVPKNKIFITYNSPNTDILFDAANEAKKLKPILPENFYRIIHVGRLVKWKKVDLLINAVSNLKKKYNSIELIVIGSGPEENNLKELAKRLNIEKSVNFIGPVYDTVTLASYFISSSVYVLAGLGGLSINEAMAFGKPVICSVCDGTERKLVRDNFNGKYFIENDLDDLAKKIDLLLRDKENLDRMGENSFSIIKNEVNINTVINGYIKSFNYVTNNKYNLSYN